MHGATKETANIVRLCLFLYFVVRLSEEKNKKPDHFIRAQSIFFASNPEPWVTNHYSL